MATKANLLSTINGFITAVITQAKHRSSMSTVVDEIYPTVYIEDETTNVVLDAQTAGLNYDFKIWKQGRTVFIQGFFTNINITSLSSPILADIKISEFIANAISTNLDAFASNGNKVQLQITNDQIIISGSLNSSRYYFSGFYPTLN
jgi:hypothetical protein